MGIYVWTFYWIGEHLAANRWTSFEYYLIRHVHEIFSPPESQLKFFKFQDFESSCLASQDFKNFENRAIIRWFISVWSWASFEVLRFWSSLATDTKIRVWTSKLSKLQNLIMSEQSLDFENSWFYEKSNICFITFKRLKIFDTTSNNKKRYKNQVLYNIQRMFIYLK